MSKDELWKLLLSRNPGMESGKAMTLRGYRKMFDLVWEQAQKEAVKDAGSDVPDFLKGMFR